MSSKAIKLSIVLPCYNEGEGLVELLEGYRAVWRDLPAELILVDNGSTDQSAEILHRELAKTENSFARTVKVEKNRGYGHGIYTGLQAAQGEFLAWSHADMQCNPADVFAAYDQLINASHSKKTIVKGQRARRELGAEIVTKGMSIFATLVLCRWLTDINAQPKVFHSSLMERLPYPPDGFPFDVYVLYQAKRAGWSLLTIPVVFGVRKHGESKWAFSFVSRWKTILRMMRYIISLRIYPSGIPPKS